MKVRLKGRFATAEDTANALGMSAPRFKRLVKLANHGDAVVEVIGIKLRKVLSAGRTPIHKNGWGVAHVKPEAAKTSHKASSQKRKSSKKTRVSERSRGKISKAR
jgi:hypothetical protein